jgi:hypothetical protein
MNEDERKVIDGTARAREWRRPKASAPRDVDAEPRSEAPKALASSLLVPMDLIEDWAAATSGDHDATDGVPSLDDRANRHDEAVASGENEEHGNVFLSGVAAGGATASPPHESPRHFAVDRFGHPAKALLHEAHSVLAHAKHGAASARRRALQTPRASAGRWSVAAIVAAVAITAGILLFEDVLGGGTTRRPATSPSLTAAYGYRTVAEAASGTSAAIRASITRVADAHMPVRQRDRPRHSQARGERHRSVVVAASPAPAGNPALASSSTPSSAPVTNAGTPPAAGAPVRSTSYSHVASASESSSSYAPAAGGAARSGYTPSSSGSSSGGGSGSRTSSSPTPGRSTSSSQPAFGANGTLGPGSSPNG